MKIDTKTGQPVSVSGTQEKQTYQGVHAGTPEWARYFRARWGVRSWDLDHEMWERVIFRRIPNVDAESLCKVIDWMVDERGWKTPSKPDEFVIGILAYRKAHRTGPVEDERANECGLCTQGWVTFWPDVRLASMTDAEVADATLLTARRESVPCLCDAGIKAWGSASEFKDLPADRVEALTKVRRRAVSQARKAAEVWARIEADSRAQGRKRGFDFRNAGTILRKA